LGCILTWLWARVLILYCWKTIWSSNYRSGGEWWYHLRRLEVALDWFQRCQIGGYLRFLQSWALKSGSWLWWGEASGCLLWNAWHHVWSLPIVDGLFCWKPLTRGWKIPGRGANPLFAYYGLFPRSR
jgi:hypothetical protein